MKEYYKVLGIEENATIEEIESSYKKLEKKYKGNNSNTAKNKLKEIRKAHEELTKKVETKEETKNQEEKVERPNEETINKTIFTKERIIPFGIGLVLGLFVMMLFFPERIAKLKSGEQVAVTVNEKDNITADDIYNRLKEMNSISVVMEKVDTLVLNKIYTLTDEDKKSIESSYQTYINGAKETYGMSEEEFIKANNFETKDDFIKYLELDYKRNKYFQENVSTEEEVEKYYNEKVYGAINTEHILVRTSTSMSDEDASNLANEILDKLKNGTSWEDLKSEYSSRIITENVKVEFDSELEANYKTEAERLSENSYSTSLVKTSYGYHIIYKKSIEEKNSLEEVKSRIQSILATEKQEENKNIYGIILANMRKDANMEIKDTEIKKLYDNYVSSLEEANN